MDYVRAVQLFVLSFMLVVLVLTGPLVDGVQLPAAEDDQLGDGTADVTVTSDPAAEMVFDDGRFGTEVVYLRIPAAAVDVHAVEGRPRLTYTVAVPELGFSRTETQLVREPGPTRVEMPARAFPPEQISGSSYRAEVQVRVQSFETDEVVYERNTTVAVESELAAESTD